MDLSRGSSVGDSVRGVVTTVYDYLPRGNTLDDETFARRHLLMCWILGLHIPALWVFGIWRGYGVGHSTLEVLPAAACLVFARLAVNRRVAAFFACAGLVWCSTILVHLSGGSIEAHFHFFILIGFIALYQDWVPLGWNVAFVVFSHGAGNVLAADLMYNHTAAQNRPWHWAVIHGVAVLAACGGVIIFWKNTEKEQQRNVTLVKNLAQTEADQRMAVSELLVNLARRNQSLLSRQLEVIGGLELREEHPEDLDELFRLDHLATRMRRNAESLLVLSGDEPPRRWGAPVPLSEVVRAAAAEIEDYWRVEVLVSDHLEVAGRAVADLAHLLAELIENATRFSPPSAEVRIRSHHSPHDLSTFVVSVEDIGVGMSDDDVRIANEILAGVNESDALRSSRLGFHVVARLAQRHGLQVRVAHTPGGGVTALVSLPDTLVTVRQAPALVGAGVDAQGGSGADGGGNGHPGGGHLDGAPYAGPVRADLARPDWRPSDRLTAPYEPVRAPTLVAPASGPEPRLASLPETGSRPPAGSLPTATPDTGRIAGTNSGGNNDPDVPEGLPRRVPGANLAPELRRQSTSEIPSVPSLPDDGPVPSVPPAPSADSGNAAQRPVDDPAGPEGLPRRVPGANLAPELRRQSTPAKAGDHGRDGERVRSMLSRFQEGQRAGRDAVATGETPRADDTSEGDS